MKKKIRFQVGDFVQFKNDPQSCFNSPRKVMAILPSGLIRHGTESFYFNSSPLDLVLTGSEYLGMKPTI